MEAVVGGSSWGGHKEFMHRALELPHGERQAFLEAHISDEAQLREALELVEGASELDGFLDEPFTSLVAGGSSALPDSIGKYEVEALLGMGSMGVVYRARQQHPERTVAIKVLRIDCAGEESVDRFRREAQLLARLFHPGIATVYDAGLCDLGAGEQPWFAMEHVEGEALVRHANRAGLDRRQRVELLLQVVQAVQYAHEAGVVHRDLKPENVLVREDGSVCVLDFGVARTVAEDASLLTLTVTGQVIGTLAYMAPEQARGAEADDRADQFALGALLYELLTGELPLAVRGRLPHDALRVVADGTWTPPSRHDASLAGDLEAILATALAPEPHRRYVDTAAFAEDLVRWLEGRPVQARRPSRFEGLLRMVRRYPWTVAGSAAALVLVSVLLTLMLRATSERAREADIAMILSDTALHTDLLAQAGQLWPTSVATVPRFDAWLAEARAMVNRNDRHRILLAGLGGLGGRSKGSRSLVASELGGDWLLGQARRLVEVIEEFQGPDGLLGEVESRRAMAASLRTETIDRRRDDWAAAADRVRADGRYFGLELIPQEGLVPLGPDPGSGLEEFALYGSGNIPARGSSADSIRPRAGDAAVLVLIPGGEHWIGTQRTDPDAPNHAPEDVPAQPHEGAPCLISLDPFLIGKFEVTQDQWQRWFDENPSDWEVGSYVRGVLTTPLNPVEGLSQQQAKERLPRLGLTLPTEAQWEVAARGGSPWPRIAGPDRADLISHANWDQQDPGLTEEERRALADPFPMHGPVGHLKPNPHGLHDVLGNVWEYCLDVFKVSYHDLEHREGDGLVLAEPDGDIARRGCGWSVYPESMHVYVRQVFRFDGRNAESGVRPARHLDLGDSKKTWRSQRVLIR